jgi:hypothetical protein
MKRLKCHIAWGALVAGSLLINSCFMIRGDVTPSGEVVELSATPGDGLVVLNWADPQDPDLLLVEVTWIPDGPATQQVDSGVASYTASGLSNGREYQFTVRTVDTNLNASVGMQVSAVPVIGLVSGSTLVVAFPFNGSADDESGNGNHGTLFGATYTTDRAGLADSAISLDGIDDSVTTELVTMNSLTAVTVAAWIQSSNTDSQSVVSKYYHSSGSDVDDSFYLGVASTAWWQLNAGAEWSGVSGTTNIADGQWHHLAGTWDGSEMLIYVDGVLEGTTAYTGSGGGHVNDTYLPVIIAVTVNDGGGPRYFDGRIDDVFVFSSALGPSDILSLFSGGG